MSRCKPFLSLACFVVLLPSIGHCDFPKAPRPAVHARQLAFSPDGKLVVALGVPVKVPINTPYKYKVETQGARVWTVADGKTYRSYPWAEPDAKQLAFSPDSQYLALPTQNAIKIVHLPTNQIKATLATPTDRKNFYFSPDGKWFLVEGDRRQAPDIPDRRSTEYYNFDIWHLGDKYTDITRTQQRVKPPFPNIKHSLEYPPDGPPVIRYKPIGPTNWCQNAQSVQWEHARVSGDGKWQAFVYKSPVGTLQIWDATKRALKFTFVLPANRNTHLMNFSPANRWFYAAPYFGFRGEFHFWNIAQGNTTHLTPNLGPDNLSPVMEVVLQLEGYTHRDVTPNWAMSPDENFMAFTHGVSPDKDFTPILNVYNLNTGQRLPVVFE